MEIFFVLLGALCVEYFFVFLKGKKFSFFSFSSLSTAIGVMLMMASTHLYIYIVVIFFGLAQKHFLQYSTKHIFNPSNFALMMGLLFFYKDAHIVLGQLGDNVSLQLILFILSTMILYRVDRWMVPVSFSIFYLLFQYFFIVSYDPVMIFEDIYHRFYSVSFLVFILFMLTDPKTTPSKKSWQILFAFCLAFVSVWLDRFNGFRIQHLFMALFLLSPLVTLSIFWQELKQRKSTLMLSLMILLLVVGTIIYIEFKPPYYFEMDG